MINIQDNTMQTILRDHTIGLFQRLVEAKFSPSHQTMDTLRETIQRLSLADLELLFSEILQFKTTQQLKHWIEERLSSPPQPAPPLPPHLERVKQRIKTLQAENPHISEKNKRLLALMDAWCSEPDDLGDEWWDEFEVDLYRNQLNFPEREIV